MTFHDDRKQLNLFRRIYILLQLRYQRLLTVAQSSALRKWCKVLGIVITVALISCAGLLWWKTNLYSESTEFPYARPDQYRLYWPYKEPPMYTFSWTYPKDEEEETNDPSASCRNTKQGKVTVADDRGYLCLRNEIHPKTGCCALTSTLNRFNCSRCDTIDPSHLQTQRCCSDYDTCVSCCMRPEQIPSLATHIHENLVQYAPNGRMSRRMMALPWFAVLLHQTQARDRFELCSAICRTDSKSVVHQGIYIDPERRHCMPLYLSD